MLMNGPSYTCNLNNSQCIQSCRFFPDCTSRCIKSYGYIPFRAMYILPQLISLKESLDKDSEMDAMIRSILYALGLIQGKKEVVSNLVDLNHNSKVIKVSELNRDVILDNIIHSIDISSLGNDIRFRLGIDNIQKKKDQSSVLESLIITIGKMYSFIVSNMNVYLHDERINIIKDFVDNYMSRLFIENNYKSKSLQILSEEEFNIFIMSRSKDFMFLDNLLKKFPNDMPNVDKLASGLLTNLRNAKSQMAKMGGTKIVDPRESLLTSESFLHRRIGVDNALFSFYKENNRTKLVNNVLFWKWSIALYYFADVIMKLDEDHELWKINFNEV